MTLRFSQRIGKTPIRNSLQSESMDDELRAGIWNCFKMAFLGDWHDLVHEVGVRFFERMLQNFFKHPIDSIDTDDAESNVAFVRKWFFKAEWHQVYDFVEYVSAGPEDPPRVSVAFHRHLGSPSAFAKMCNEILEREMAGYRIVKGEVMRITDEQELQAIEVAVSQAGPWSTAAEHIRKSAALLFDRKSPDYPNAVKEAISAVESASCAVTGKPHSTLAQALKEIEKKHPLHEALKKAFSTLYGYTSDAGGIRHGGIELADVSFEDAKYMLVACSAFVNYLKGISAQSK